MTFETKFRNFVGRLKNKEFSHQELTIMADELLREYNNERKVNIESWKGKSSFSFIEVGDNIIVTKYQRPEKGAEPKEVKTEISLSELQHLESKIKTMFNYDEYDLQIDKLGDNFIKSRDLAEAFYQIEWKEIFNERKKHNKFTIMLNVLEKKHVIIYRGGRIYLE